MHPIRVLYKKYKKFLLKTRYPFGVLKKKKTYRKIKKSKKYRYDIKKYLLYKNSIEKRRFYRYSRYKRGLFFKKNIFFVKIINGFIIK